MIEDKPQTDPDNRTAVVAQVERSVRPLAIAWLYPDGRPCTLSWAGQDEVRMQAMAASHGLIRQELFAHQPPAKRTPVVGGGLDYRTMNCLLAEGFEYIEDAQARHDSDLLKIPNFGRVTLARLRAWPYSRT